MWSVNGGGVALCGALSYGALARQMTESDGEYLFLSRAVHPLLGFLAGWVSLLAGFIGLIALFLLYALVTLPAPVWHGGPVYNPGDTGATPVLHFCVCCHPNVDFAELFRLQRRSLRCRGSAECRRLRPTGVPWLPGVASVWVQRAAVRRLLRRMGAQRAAGGGLTLQRATVGG